MKTFWIVCCLISVLQEKEPGQPKSVKQDPVKQEPVKQEPVVKPFSKRIQDFPRLPAQLPPVVSQVQPVVSQADPTKSKGKSRAKSLVPIKNETLDEIREIRERIGIKLFDDGVSNQEFLNQLRKLGNSPPPISRAKTLPGEERPERSSVAEPVFGHVPAANQLIPRSSTPAPRISPNRENQPASWVQRVPPPGVSHAILSGPVGPREARKNSTIQSLISSCENLDRFALELDLSGEAEKSKKMRKLSRTIRKQLLQLTNSRDN